MNENSFLDRLNIEFNELQDKRNKLNEFMNTNQFVKLSLGNIHLLQKQCICMTEYLDILRLRIELNSK